jgi:hypothetical protein
MSALEVPVNLKLMPELAGIRLSPEEFDAVEECDDQYNYELVHGVLIVAPPPDVGERRPNDRLGYLLQSYQDHHPQGSALDLTLPEHLIRTPNSRRRADRVIWTGLGRTPNTRQTNPPLLSSSCLPASAIFSRITLTNVTNTCAVLEYRSSTAFGGV